MRKIFYPLFILILFVNCSKNEPPLMLNPLNVPMATDSRDIRQSNNQSHRSIWIKQFNRQQLESDVRTLLDKVDFTGHFEQNDYLPPLVYCGIYAAISSNHPFFEYLQDANKTGEVHGGEEFFILTIDLGFGVDPSAVIDEVKMEEVYKESIVLDNQLIGDIRWWKIKIQNGGYLFIYRNTPLDTSQDYLETTLEIQMGR